MSQPARRIEPFDDLYRRIQALPAGMTGLILRPGVLSTMSRPGLPHQQAEKQMLRSLSQFDGGSGADAWWIFSEVEIRLSGDLLVVPDAAGWRAQRVPRMPLENPLTLLPDWACEILSPTTERDDRLLKLPLYARAGVRWVWLVDPELRSVEVYESIGERPSLVAGARDDEAMSLAPFGEPIALGGWWMGSP